jgi:hypothetical protein
MTMSPLFHHNFSRLSHKLPHSWIVAHTMMQDLNMSLHDTDISYILSGQVALQHLAQFPCPTLPSPHLLHSLAQAGMMHLCHIATWSTSNIPTNTILQPHPDLPALLQFTSAFPHLSIITSWLSSLSLPLLTYSHPSLAIPPATCQ